ncbi:MAG: hypothetical protein MJ252_09560, partial [archaeon]|nr:hypothetical protein [archaeon]
MLNNEMYINFFKDKKIPVQEVIILYRIYFQILKKEEIISLKEDNEFWEKASNYILEGTEKNEKQMGKFIEEDIKNSNFTDDNIHIISKLAEPYVNIINAQYFSKICSSAGLYSFFVKDALEYMGIIPSKRASPSRIYKNINYEINLEKQ